jgi:hypothetical protein
MRYCQLNFNKEMATAQLRQLTSATSSVTESAQISLPKSRRKLKSGAGSSRRCEPGILIIQSQTANAQRFVDETLWESRLLGAIKLAQKRSYNLMVG